MLPNGIDAKASAACSTEGKGEGQHLRQADPAPLASLRRLFCRVKWPLQRYAQRVSLTWWSDVSLSNVT